MLLATWTRASCGQIQFYPVLVIAVITEVFLEIHLYYLEELFWVVMGIFLDNSD
jgi:hypothetical protein